MSNSHSKTSKIPLMFKMSFWAVTAFSFICIAVLVYMSFSTKATTMDQVPVFQKNLYEICKFGWQSGFGAIIGLVGGNVSSQ